MKLVKPIDLFRHVKKCSSAQSARLLGLDVGNKFVGLAVSDTNNLIASPLSVLVRDRNNIGSMAGDFRTLVSELSLEGLIVGLPIRVQFQASINNIETVPIRCFMNALQKAGKLEYLRYTYWDENNSTKRIKALLDPLNLHPDDAKTIVDKFAAVNILQDYLDSMNREFKMDSKLIR